MDTPHFRRIPDERIRELLQKEDALTEFEAYCVLFRELDMYNRYPTRYNEHKLSVEHLREAFNWRKERTRRFRNAEGPAICKDQSFSKSIELLERKIRTDSPDEENSEMNHDQDNQHAFDGNRSKRCPTEGGTEMGTDRWCHAAPQQTLVPEGIEADSCHGIPRMVSIRSTEEGSTSSTSISSLLSSACDTTNLDMSWVELSDGVYSSPASPAKEHPRQESFRLDISAFLREGSDPGQIPAPTDEVLEPAPFKPLSTEMTSRKGEWVTAELVKDIAEKEAWKRLPNAAPDVINPNLKRDTCLSCGNRTRETRGERFCIEQGCPLRWVSYRNWREAERRRIQADIERTYNETGELPEGSLVDYDLEL